MKFENLQSGMLLWAVSREKMGNAPRTTVKVCPVRIVSVDLVRRRVLASWDGNSPRPFYEDEFKGWRAKKPALVKGRFIQPRLATRAKVAELEAKKAQAQAGKSKEGLSCG